ncbi:MAG: hypothetical protein VXW26_10935, partial [SAR324 cluster bacterium]|nr:hypothetical protein [SAR324 cluster bacterium]
MGWRRDETLLFKKKIACRRDETLVFDFATSKVGLLSRRNASFQKSDPPEAAPLLAPCLKIAQKVWKIHQWFLRDVNFQKTDPPEAAPLLAPCLKIAQKVKEFIQGGVIFQKS